jgi:hypothetical protein
VDFLFWRFRVSRNAAKEEKPFSRNVLKAGGQLRAAVSVRNHRPDDCERRGGDERPCEGQKRN